MAEGLVIVSKEQILQRICGEFLEMPGLRLTLPQAQRLWDLDASTCSQLLQSLVEQRFLYHHRDGTYSRMSDAIDRIPIRMARAGKHTSAHASRK